MRDSVGGGVTALMYTYVATINWLSRLLLAINHPSKTCLSEKSYCVWAQHALQCSLGDFLEWVLRGRLTSSYSVPFERKGGKERGVDSRGGNYWRVL